MIRFDRTPDISIEHTHIRRATAASIWKRGEISLTLFFLAFSRGMTQGGGREGKRRRSE